MKIVCKKHNFGEVLGVFPAGQPVSVSHLDGARQIIINGVKGIISNELFHAIFEEHKYDEVVPVETKKKGVKHGINS